MAGDRDGPRDRSDAAPPRRAHRRDEPRGAPSHRRAPRRRSSAAARSSSSSTTSTSSATCPTCSPCSTRAACSTPARSRRSRPAPRCRRSTSPVSDAPLLAVRGLSTYYGHSQALFDVDLEAGPQGAVAVLGRNGAGKTTLLKTIVGELRPRQGRDRLRRARRHPHPDRAAGAVGPRLRPAGARGLRPAVRAREPCGRGHHARATPPPSTRSSPLFPKLGQRLHQRAGTLSGGERKMLAVGRALLTRPKLLLLDEPTEGVWVGVIEEIAPRLTELATPHRARHRRAAPRAGPRRRPLRLCAGPRAGRARGPVRDDPERPPAPALSGAVSSTTHSSRRLPWPCPRRPSTSSRQSPTRWVSPSARATSRPSSTS